LVSPASGVIGRALWADGADTGGTFCTAETRAWCVGTTPHRTVITAGMAAEIMCITVIVNRISIAHDDPPLMK